MFTRAWDGLGLARWACVFVLYLFCVFVFCIWLTVTGLALANRHIRYHKLKGTQWKCTHAAVMTMSQPSESTQKSGWLYSRTFTVAPLDQKDAHVFVVPPGGAKETGAIGHKYGWLPHPTPTLRRLFIRIKALLLLKRHKLLWGTLKERYLKIKHQKV